MFQNDQYPNVPGGSPYDFIMQGRQKPKRNLIPSGLSLRRRLLFIIGGAAVFIIVLIMVANMFSSSNGGTLTELRSIAQQQQELIRITTIGSQASRSAEALDLAATTKSVIEADQTATLAYLKSQKKSLNQKDLNLGRDAKTDQLFTQAEQTNQFDDTFTATIQAKLTTYQQTVKKAYDGATGKKAKQLLADEYNHVQVLLAKKPTP